MRFKEDIMKKNIYVVGAVIVQDEKILCVTKRTI